MPSRTRQLPPADDVASRYVYVTLPACPACGGLDLRTYRTTREGDGAVARHSRCVACAHRFIVVHEPEPRPTPGRNPPTYPAAG